MLKLTIKDISIIKWSWKLTNQICVKSNNEKWEILLRVSVETKLHNRALKEFPLDVHYNDAFDIHSFICINLENVLFSFFNVARRPRSLLEECLLSVVYTKFQKSLLTLKIKIQKSLLGIKKKNLRKMILIELHIYWLLKMFFSARFLT